MFGQPYREPNAKDPPPYHGPWTDQNQKAQAEMIRRFAILQFKRDYFLAKARSARLNSIEQDNEDAQQLAEILFPAVTEVNARDYLNRAL
jgi:hypothetical protein